MTQQILPARYFFACLTPWLLLSPGCYQTAELQCHYTSDCAPSSYCRAGQCIPASPQQPGKPKSPPPAGSDPHATPSNNDSLGETPDSPPAPCPDGRAPASGDLVLNEFLVNVPAGPAGDANNDGVRHAHDDEFIELVNLTTNQLDLSGVRIQNASSTKYTFTRFCLDAGHAVVIFGGLEPGATLPSGPGFQSLIAHARFMFNNDQGTIIVRAADNQELIHLNYERAPPQALTLSPQLHGTQFVPHSTLHADTLFSPGSCANPDQSLTSGCPPDDQDSSEDPDAEIPEAGDE